MDTRVADPLNGALIDGRYRIHGRIAQGGMATVYHAIDERLGRTVAVKIIRPSQAHDSRFLRRFADEAKTIARLTHPNVVAVYDQGTYEGLPYLVMEYIRGDTLRGVLAERHRLDPADALAILEQVLAALAVAHRGGLVHRDVKPENVLVTLPPNGSGDLVDAVVKVADFGLARAVEASTDAVGGQIMATAAYAAPELIAHNRADARADIYSVGVMLFEMLTGRTPYDGGRPVDVAWQHVNLDMPAPSAYLPGLPALLDDLVLKATRRNPAARPADATAMLAEVRAVRDDLAALARAPHGTTQAFAQPTMVIPPISPVDERPAWARLPARDAPMPGRRRAEPEDGPGLSDRVGDAVARMRYQFQRMSGTQRGRRQLIAVAVVLGLVGLVGGWWLGFGRYTTAPNLVTLTKANATAEARQLGFDIRDGAGQFSETVPKDTVMAQDPEPGQRIVRGGTITLRLSLGPERYEVPEVSGQALDFAVTELQQHFTVQKVSGYSDTLPQSFVISTDPPAGTPLKPGATVKVTVSKGPYPLHVPGVVGKQLGEAQSILQSQGFQVGAVTYQDSDKPRDQVLTQDPAEGAGAVQGEKVNLVLSNGPPGQPMPSVVNVGCNDARNQLQGMGLTVNVKGNLLEQQFGHVVAQQPAPGTQLQPGQQVQIRCSL